jgi:hypothetical protein
VRETHRFLDPGIGAFHAPYRDPVDHEETRMATRVETHVRPAEAEQRFLLVNVGWDGYETMLRLVGDRRSA